jgi:hypothetical protein
MKLSCRRERPSSIQFRTGTANPYPYCVRASARVGTCSVLCTTFVRHRRVRRLQTAYSRFHNNFSVLAFRSPSHIVCPSRRNSGGSTINKVIKISCSSVLQQSCYLLRSIFSSYGERRLIAQEIKLISLIIHYSCPIIIEPPPVHYTSYIDISSRLNQEGNDIFMALKCCSLDSRSLLSTNYIHIRSSINQHLNHSLITPIGSFIKSSA